MRPRALFERFEQSVEVGAEYEFFDHCGFVGNAARHPGFAELRLQQFEAFLGSVGDSERRLDFVHEPIVSKNQLSVNQVLQVLNDR